MATLSAVLDACVLYSAPLRDLLVNLALVDLFRARWTEAIHEEWTRNLREKRPDLPSEKIGRTRDLLNASVPDSLIVGHEFLIPTLDLPDPDDRHVLAAAIHGRADVIVTYDLSHFPTSVLASHHVEARHPDEFITDLFRFDEPRVIAAVKRLRAGLRKPPVSAHDYLNILERQSLSQSVALLRPFIDRV